MEFTIDKAELLSALYLTQGIVERRTTIPILSNVLVQSVASGVTVTATDQEVTVCRQCNATVKNKGALTTSARKLYEMTREFPDGDVKFRSLESGWIEISSARARFRLVGLDPREFPTIEAAAAGEGAGVHLPAAMLAEMIERTLFAVSADETRVNLHGIYIEGTGDAGVRVVATDGHRLAMLTRKIEGKLPEKGVIIPRKAVQELRKVLEGEGGDVIDLAIGSGVARARRGPVEMSMRLIEGEFPDYRQVVPAKSERLASLPVGALLAALRRISVVSSERTRGVKLQLDGNKMEISSINPDVGEGAEEIEIDYDGGALSIGFNARYLIEALGLFQSDDKVELGFNDDVSPGVLRVASDPDYCYIVMPMRL